MDKCLHVMECDQCFEQSLEMFEHLDSFFKLVDAARKNNMTISANAFAIKELEKTYRFHLSKEKADEIWERIQAELKPS